MKNPAPKNRETGHFQLCFIDKKDAAIRKPAFWPAARVRRKFGAENFRRVNSLRPSADEVKTGGATAGSGTHEKMLVSETLLKEGCRKATST